MVNNDKQESIAYRRQVTSQLYKRTNGNFASELLNESGIISTLSLKTIIDFKQKEIITFLWLFSIEAASWERLKQHRWEAQQQQPAETTQEGTEQEEQQTAVDDDDDDDIGIEGLEKPSEVGSESITAREFRKEAFITEYHTVNKNNSLLRMTAWLSIFLRC